MIIEGGDNAAVMTHEISMDTVTRGIALRQLKRPFVTSRIPNTTFREAVNIPIDFHVHCREMRPTLGAVLVPICGAGSAREGPPRRVVRKAFAIPAIVEVNVVSQACCICIAIRHGEAQAGISVYILLRIRIRSVSRRASELDWLRGALARVSSEVDSSLLEWGGIECGKVSPVRVANEHLEACWEGCNRVGSRHRVAGESVGSDGFAM